MTDFQTFTQLWVIFLITIYNYAYKICLQRKNNVWVFPLNYHAKSESFNERLPLQSSGMCGDSIHRAMVNYTASQNKRLSHDYNSYWQQNNNSVVGSQTRKKWMWAFPTYFPVEKPVCPQWRVSHSLPSEVHQAIRPCVVGFHKGVTNLSRPLVSKHVLHWLDLILILFFFSWLQIGSLTNHYYL